MGLLSHLTQLRQLVLRDPSLLARMDREDVYEYCRTIVVIIYSLRMVLGGESWCESGIEHEGR
jgi:DNA-binding response OmpR family regulator